jgi:hypothetical protein
VLNQRIDRIQDFRTLGDQANSSADSLQTYSSFQKLMSDANFFALEQAMGNISLELGQPSEDLVELIKAAIINNWSSKELIQSIQDANRA